jgi:cation transport protein ChaC
VSPVDNPPIDRAQLARDAVRHAVRAAGHGHLLLSDAELDASLQAALAGRHRRAPVWVFAYGSLVWSPLLQAAKRLPARVHGWHRGFYLRSMINRGTPDQPGLVMALDRGGACAGIAMQLRRATQAEDLTLLWRREMITGAYQPRWVQARTATGTVQALAFVMDRAHPSYAGRLDDDTILETVRRARGHFGPCSEYLLETASSLERHGIADARLTRLARRLGGGE